MYVIYDNKYVDYFDYISRCCIYILVVDNCWSFSH